MFYFNHLYNLAHLYVTLYSHNGKDKITPELFHNQRDIYMIRDKKKWSVRELPDQRPAELENKLILHIFNPVLNSKEFTYHDYYMHIRTEENEYRKFQNNSLNSKYPDYMIYKIVLQNNFNIVYHAPVSVARNKISAQSHDAFYDVTEVNKYYGKRQEIRTINLHRDFANYPNKKSELIKEFIYKESYPAQNIRDAEIKLILDRVRKQVNLNFKKSTHSHSKKKNRNPKPRCNLMSRRLLPRNNLMAPCNSLMSELIERLAL